MIAGTVNNQRFSFTKDERLKSKKRIDELFRDKTFVQNPTLRIYFKQVELDCAFLAQFAFANAHFRASGVLIGFCQLHLENFS